VAYNKVYALKYRKLDENDTQDSMRAELFPVREEVQSSRLWLYALRNSPEEFQKLVGGSAALFEMVGEKIFLTISNIYFFNQSKGM
jgi:hypothetical protein